MKDWIDQLLEDLCFPIVEDSWFKNLVLLFLNFITSCNVIVKCDT